MGSQTAAWEQRQRRNERHYDGRQQAQAQGSGLRDVYSVQLNSKVLATSRTDSGTISIVHETRNMFGIFGRNSFRPTRGAFKARPPSFQSLSHAFFIRRPM